MLSPLPRHSDWGHCFAHSPSPVSLPRNGGQVGLCNVLFEACSAFTRVTACTLAGSSKMTRYIRGFSHFVTSMTAPITSGWSKIAGWDSHPLRNAALARRTPSPDLQRRTKMATEAAAGTGTTCILRSLLTMTESPGAMRKSHCHAQVTSPETGPASSSSMVVILSSCNFKSVDGKFAIST